MKLPNGGEMKVIIAGSRNIIDKELVDAVINKFIIKFGKPEIIVTGGAKGVDSIGWRWALKKCILLRKVFLRKTPFCPKS